MKDFTIQDRPEPIEFKIDDDVFRAYPVVPAHIMIEMMKIAGESPGKQATTVLSFLDEILHDASAQRFADRMKSKEEPITLPQLVEVFKYLVGELSGRPTQQPSDSSDGLTATGASSMAGVPVEE